MNQLDDGCLEIEDLAAMKSVCRNLESTTFIPEQEWLQLYSIQV